MCPLKVPVPKGMLREGRDNTQVEEKRQAALYM